MAFKVTKSGNYIFVEDLSNNSLYDYRAKDLTIDKPTDAATTYNFVYRGKALSFLTGININDLMDENDVAYTVPKWEGFYRNSTNQYSIESDVSNDTVTVTRDAAIKLLDFNWNRKGMSFTNSGAVDVCIRFKAAATDNNIEGLSLFAGQTIILDKASYIGEVSSIRSTTSGTQTSDIKVMEW